jgi:hypothetical protein
MMTVNQASLDERLPPFVGFENPKHGGVGENAMGARDMPLKDMPIWETDGHRRVDNQKEIIAPQLKISKRKHSQRNTSSVK